MARKSKKPGAGMDWSWWIKDCERRASEATNEATAKEWRRQAESYRKLEREA